MEYGYKLLRKQTVFASPGPGNVAIATVPHLAQEGVRRYVVGVSMAYSSQAALVAAGELLVSLYEGSVATGSVRAQFRSEVAAAVIPLVSRILSGIEIEVAGDTDLNFAQAAAIAGLNVDVGVTVEDRLYD